MPPPQHLPKSKIIFRDGHSESALNVTGSNDSANRKDMVHSVHMLDGQPCGVAKVDRSPETVNN